MTYSSVLNNAANAEILKGMTIFLERNTTYEKIR